MRSSFKRRTEEARRLLIRTSSSFEIEDSKSASDGAKWFCWVVQGVAVLFFLWYFVGLPWLYRRLYGPLNPGDYGSSFTLGTLLVGTLALGVVFNVSHWLVWASDPGFVAPCVRNPPSTTSTREGSIGAETANDHRSADALGNELRWCEKCCHHQPIRTRHCRKCGKCVRKFDHHCFWVSTCIGERNHFRFTVLLLWATLYLLAGCILMLTHIESSASQTSMGCGSKKAIDLHCHVQTGHQPVCGSPCFVTWSVWLAFNGVPLIVAVLCFLMFVFAVSLLFLHLYLLDTNQTTWEVSSGPPKNTITYLIKAQTSAPFDDGLIRNGRVALLAAALAGDVPCGWVASQVAGGFPLEGSEGEEELTGMEEGCATNTCAHAAHGPENAAVEIVWPPLSVLGKSLLVVGCVVRVGCCLRASCWSRLVVKVERLTRGKAYGELKVSRKARRNAAPGGQGLAFHNIKRWSVVLCETHSPNNDNCYQPTIEWHPF